MNELDQPYIGMCTLFLPFLLFKNYFIQNKMQYLRGQFTLEIPKAKELKSGVSTNDFHVPTAYWFYELNFFERLYSNTKRKL